MIISFFLCKLEPNPLEMLRYVYFVVIISCFLACNTKQNNQNGNAPNEVAEQVHSHQDHSGHNHHDENEVVSKNNQAQEVARTPGNVDPQQLILTTKERTNYFKTMAITSTANLDSIARREKQNSQIKEYLQLNGLEMEKTNSGMYYKILETGTKAIGPLKDQIISIHYTGHTFDKGVFETSAYRQEAAKYYLTKLLPGWKEAVLLLGVGGKGFFVLPSHLAFRDKAYTERVAAHSPLMYELEVISVYQPPTKN